MNDRENIHPDFRSIKARELSFKRSNLAILNGILTTVNRLARLKFRNVVADEILEPDGHRIPLLVIKPKELSSSRAALIYYHGGAFVMKHCPQHLDNAVRYARDADCCVIFVDYRLAPKYPFPAGFNDCHAALRWTVANADKLGIDKDRIAVGGDSAGGAMAASVAQKAAHEDGMELCGQLLIYPVTDSDDKWPSAKASANVPPFKGWSSTALWEAYLGHRPSTGPPRYASPMQGNLTGLAQAYIETAEFDPCRDEGKAYAQALAAQGIEVQLNATKGTVHGFDLLVSGSQITKAALDARVQFLRKCFRS